MSRINAKIVGFTRAFWTNFQPITLYSALAEREPVSGGREGNFGAKTRPSMELKLEIVCSGSSKQKTPRCESSIFSPIARKVGLNTHEPSYLPLHFPSLALNLMADVETFFSFLFAWGCSTLHTFVFSFTPCLRKFGYQPHRTMTSSFPSPPATKNQQKCLVFILSVKVSFFLQWYPLTR